MLEARILTSYLTATGLPYTVVYEPPLARRGPRGLRVTFDDDEPQFLFLHNREWWWFSTWASDSDDLRPAWPTHVSTRAWPLELGMAILGTDLIGWWGQIAPSVKGTLGERRLATNDADVLRAADLFARGIRLLELTASQELKLNSKAVAPLAAGTLSLRSWEPRV